MNIYIGGKITGDPDYYAKFQKLADYYAGTGHAVLNPAELPEGMSELQYMSICIQMIFAADKCVFLPDWQESGGARIEHALARYCHIPIQVVGEE